MSEPVKDDPAPAMKIVIERSPWPKAEPPYLFTAYYEGCEDGLARSGKSPEEALSRFLAALEETP